MSKKGKTELKNIALMVFGTLLVSAAYALFFIPHDIAPGGVGGLAVLLNKFIPIGVGVLTILLNIPIFVFAYKILGRKFVIKTIFLLLLMSVGMDSVSINVVPDDRFLASVCGGLFMGVGLGLVMYAGASTGGTDTIALILNKKFPGMGTSGILLMLDIAVVILSAVVHGVTTAIYSAITVMLEMLLIDYVFDGIKSAVAVYIISQKPRAVKKHLYQRLDRGVTDIFIQGGFSEKNNIMLLCIVPKRELTQVKNCVKEVDSSAFMFETGTKCVIGNGFEPFN